MEFNDILQKINGWGLYQKRMWFLFTIVAELAVTHDQMITMFAGAAPDWTCLDSDYEYLSHNSSTKCDILMQCTNMSFAEDIRTIVTDFRLYCDRSSIMEMMMSLQMAGVLVGAFFWGQTAEIFGRKKTLMFIYAVIIFSSISASLSQTATFFACTIFLMGLGAGGYFSVNFVMMQETIEPKMRLLPVCISGFTFGMLLYVCTTWMLRDWRKILFWVNGIGALGFFFFFWIEESPRWLIQHCKYAEAEKAIGVIARTNGRLAPSSDDLLLLRSSATKKRRYTYHHLFRTAQLTKYTLVLAASWFVVSCVSYALAFNVKNLPGDRFMNLAFLSVTGAISSWLTILWNRWFGRRTMHQFSLTAVAFCLAVVVLVMNFGQMFGDKEGLIITTFAILGGSLNSPSWQVVYLYTAELFPTVVRNLSNGLCSMAARVGGIIAPLLLLSTDLWRPLPYSILFSICIGNLILAVFLLPETRNRPLPDVLPPKQSSKVNLTSSGVMPQTLTSIDSKTTPTPVFV